MLRLSSTMRLTAKPTLHLAQVCEIDPSHDADLPDVVSMNNLHEAPLLHLLRRRLVDSQQIYTWAGQDILISVNPYHAVPCYGAEHLASAHAAAELAESPHVYALARRAHADLLARDANHSIVISGESGAGLTASLECRPPS